MFPVIFEELQYNFQRFGIGSTLQNLCWDGILPETFSTLKVVDG